MRMRERTSYCHRAARRRYGICSAVLICGLVATEAAAQPTWCGGHSIEWAGGPPRAFSALADGSSSALAIEQPAWLVRDRWDALVFNAFENPSPEGRLTEVLARGDVSSIRVCMQSPETSEVGQLLEPYSDASWVAVSHPPLDGCELEWRDCDRGLYRRTSPRLDTGSSGPGERNQHRPHSIHDHPPRRGGRMGLLRAGLSAGAAEPRGLGASRHRGDTRSRAWSRYWVLSCVGCFSAVDHDSSCGAALAGGREPARAVGVPGWTERAVPWVDSTIVAIE